jgi:two-component system chemotaxis response regulator CheV
MTVTIGRPVLEVGSNIFEIVEFVLDQGTCPAPISRTSFGVNVAKVREVIRMPEIVPCLTSCPAVLGVFNLRGHPIPVIHLAKALGLPNTEISSNSQIIVTEFSRRLAGFVVAGTKRIRRVSWDKVLPPSSETFGHITGMMLIENSQFIFILDFERILIDIEGNGSLSTHGASSHYSNSEPRGIVDGRKPAMHLQQKGQLVVVVDDSPTARRSMSDLLAGMGLNCVTFSNGEEAWLALNDPGQFESYGGVGAVICDIEMPKLDGYSLAKRIRSDQQLKKTPFILHSSLTGQVNKDRAFQSGADAYVAKFNKREISEALMRFLPGGLQGNAS